MGKFHSKEFSKIAKEYCKGEGIEIGGLHSRLQVDAKVKNLDYLDTKTLKEKYKNDKNINLNDLWEVDIISQAWDLSEIESNSLDFVMSSHVLEHLPNPGVAIQEWIRAVKSGGTVFFIVPDMRYCFDKKRKLTSQSDLIDKYNSKNNTVSYETYDEFVKMTSGVDGRPKEKNQEELIKKMYEEQANIHVHTFIDTSIAEFCNFLGEKIGFKVKKVHRDGLNINVVLSKNL
jgi:predicted SAM-dependent methyltransferase